MTLPRHGTKACADRISELSTVQLSQLSSMSVTVSRIAADASNATHVLDTACQENQLIGQNIIARVDDYGRHTAHSIENLSREQARQVEQLRNLVCGESPSLQVRANAGLDVRGSTTTTLSHLQAQPAAVHL